MIIFKDILTDCEVATDSQKPKLVDDLIYEFEAKLINRRTDVGDINIGGNKSAEDPGEEDADDVIAESGYDFVLNNQLEAYPMKDKKAYQTELKKYMKKLEAKLKEEESGRLNVFKEKIQPYVKDLLKKFDKLEFYIHSEAIPKSDDGFPGMLIILEFGNDAKGETYTFKLFKDGLLEEKA